MRRGGQWQGGPGARADVAVHADGEPDRRERIDQIYLDAFSGVAEERARLGGFRLAHLLNQALDPTYAGPAANGMRPG